MIDRMKTHVHGERSYAWQNSNVMFLLLLCIINIQWGEHYATAANEKAADCKADADKYEIVTPGEELERELERRKRDLRHEKAQHHPNNPHPDMHTASTNTDATNQDHEWTVVKHRPVRVHLDRYGTVEGTREEPPLATFVVAHSTSTSTTSSSTNNRDEQISQQQRERQQQQQQKKQVFVWRGIPFAVPPVGSLRFAPPEPPLPWTPATLQATHFRPDCWQDTSDPSRNPTADPNHQSEDCLYLNIFAPTSFSTTTNNQHNIFKKKKPHKLVPVMVWLHGGAFEQGGASRHEYDGRRLAQRNVVVVTLNYRLGALGFLVSSKDALHGNFGIMDQRAALDWIRENIAAFGGDPDNVTLFGESAGAVMIGIHLQNLESSSSSSSSSSQDSEFTERQPQNQQQQQQQQQGHRLFHKVILQSNPLGYTFRSVVVANFIGEALKKAVDCRDLSCLRAEPVEEIIRAQSSLMGIPRSVGDFFTWGPTLTEHVSLGRTANSASASRNVRNSRRFLEKKDIGFNETVVVPKAEMQNHDAPEKWPIVGYEGLSAKSRRWSGVRVRQPLKGDRFIDTIPHDIPILVGCNQHEGELFVHSAFPAPMPKAVYWMFVGALFRDNASNILKHYRVSVETVEQQAEELAWKQIQEEENKQYFYDHRHQLDEEYRRSMRKTSSSSPPTGVSFCTSNSTSGDISAEALMDIWSSDQVAPLIHNRDDTLKTADNLSDKGQNSKKNPSEKLSNEKEQSSGGHIQQRMNRKALRRATRRRAQALKEAAKVIIDYRPVMSQIIGDYLFRCPTWHYAQILSKARIQKRASQEQNIDNIEQTAHIYVYRFSQPTHVPGYKECWGNACHTAELPYPFQAMSVIRSNYSTLSDIAQKEAPSAPEYHFTDVMEAYRSLIKTTPLRLHFSNHDEKFFQQKNHTRAFQRIRRHFVNESLFVDDADEQLANDMANRWTAFAKTGNPNYSGSPSEWLPWMDVSEESHGEKKRSNILENSEENMDRDWFLWDDQSDDDDDMIYMHLDEVDKIVSKQQSSHAMVYRQRALDALHMEVVHEDVYQTELGRVQNDKSISTGRRSTRFWPFEISQSHDRTQTKPTHDITRLHIRKAVQLAQEADAMGFGLGGNSDSATFSELLDLSWPPHGRIIERDCTCDLWDTIQYRY